MNTQCEILTNEMAEPVGIRLDPRFGPADLRAAHKMLSAFGEQWTWAEVWEWKRDGPFTVAPVVDRATYVPSPEPCDDPKRHPNCMCNLPLPVPIKSLTPSAALAAQRRCAA